jgi:hypothetical protein
MKKLFVVLAVIAVLAAAYLIAMNALDRQVGAALDAKKAAGQPMTLAELPKHKDASGGKAAGLLAQAQAALDTGTDSTAYARADSNLAGPAEVKALLTRNARTIELLLEASRQPRQSMSIKLEDGPAARIDTTLHSWPKFFVLLRLRARDLLAQGKADEAMDVVLAGLRVSDLLAADVSAFYGMVQNRFNREMMPVIQVIAPRCSDAGRSRAAAAVAALELDRDFVKGWSAEAVTFVACFREYKPSFLQAMGIDDNLPNRVLYFFPPTNRIGLRQYIETSKRYIELAARPWYEARTQWDSLEQVCGRLKEQHSPLASVILANPAAFTKRLTLHQAQRAVTLAGLRVLQYQRAHRGTLPRTLDAAGKDFGADPYTGKPLGYSIKGTSFRLYSVGVDLKDDGGDAKTDVAWSTGI